MKGPVPLMVSGVSEDEVKKERVLGKLRYCWKCARKPSTNDLDTCDECLAELKENP